MKLEDKVLERIDSLGGKLDNISQHAWEALVKYQIINSITDLIVGVIIIALTVFLWKVFINQHKKVSSEYDGHSLLFEFGDELSAIGLFYVVIVSILSLVAFAYLVYGIPMDIVRILNPEVFAVKDLIEQSKGGS